MIFIMNSMTGATNAYPSGAPGFAHGL
jgi:hypothetical protein